MFREEPSRMEEMVAHAAAKAVMVGYGRMLKQVNTRWTV